MPEIKWRPKDWNKRRIEAIHRVIIDLQHDKESAFVESGAGAMIEALKEQGVRIFANGNEQIEISGKNGLSLLMASGRGVVTFIPEDIQLEEK